MGRILFATGGLGLGHVARDIAIAGELRRLRPEIEIDWLAVSPAKEYLLTEGEHVLPEVDRLPNPTPAAEGSLAAGKLNLADFAFAFRKQWAAGGRFSMSLMESGEYDLFLGDETYEVIMQLAGRPSPPCLPIFVLFDFLGLDATTWSPLERLIVLGFNRAWSSPPEGRYQPVFLGELEDIPARRFLPLGPTRREWAERHAIVVDHVLDFDPRMYDAPPARAALRKRLGYGPDPTVLVSVGGTAVGRDLVRRCLEAFPHAREVLPGLRMRVVCGPRLRPANHSSPDGVEMLGYVPRLYEHFAACDLAIVQGGGTTTLELTSLRRPFLYFPLEGHCEQLMHVAPRQRRLGAGVELMLRKTSAPELANHIRAHLGEEVTYKDVPVNGARLLAEHVIAALP